MISELDVTDADHATATELLASYDGETVGKSELIGDLADKFGNQHKIKYMFVLHYLHHEEGLIEYCGEKDVFLIRI